MSDWANFCKISINSTVSIQLHAGRNLQFNLSLFEIKSRSFGEYGSLHFQTKSVAKSQTLCYELYLQWRALQNSHRVLIRNCLNCAGWWLNLVLYINSDLYPYTQIQVDLDGGTFVEPFVFYLTLERFLKIDIYIRIKLHHPNVFYIK